MSTEALGAPQALVSLRQQLRVFWSGLAVRERMALAAGGVLVAVLLVWWVAVQPALRTLREAPAQLDRLDRQLQQMQATSAEVTALRAIAPVSATQAAAALKAATDRLGDKGRLAVQGERATIALTNVGTDAFRSWLGEVRGAARARPVEASLTRAQQGYSGTVVVMLAGSP